LCCYVGVEGKESKENKVKHNCCLQFVLQFRLLMYYYYVHIKLFDLIKVFQVIMVVILNIHKKGDVMVMLLLHLLVLGSNCYLRWRTTGCHGFF